MASWRVDRLSKGMSQKVQIAGALLADPELCVLDEPTTGLDPVNVRLVQDLLLERRRNGRTTILSTHHMNQVEALCDRVALIHKGQLMVYGAVDEVRRRHSLPEVIVHAQRRCPRCRAVATASDLRPRHGGCGSADGGAPSDLLAALVAPGRASIASSRRWRRWKTSSCGWSGEARVVIRWHKVAHGRRVRADSAVKRTGFLVITFGMPLFIAGYAALVAVPAYYAAKRDREQPAIFGVVDRPGILDLQGDIAPPRTELDEDTRRLLEATGQTAAVDRALPRSSLLFRPFASAATARQELAARTLRGYFVLTDDYLRTGRVESYGPDTIGGGVATPAARWAFSCASGWCAAGPSRTIAARIIAPLPDVRRFAVTRSGEIKDGGSVASAVRVAIPLAFTVLFLMSVLMTSGYLLQGTATEKENKVVEVLLASANPDEILAGKLMGLGAAGLIQVGGVDGHAVRDRLRRHSAAVRGAGRDAVADAAGRAAALHARVPVLRQPDARHRLARLEHARSAAALDDVVAHRGAAADADERADPRTARPGGARDDLAAAHRGPGDRHALQPGRGLTRLVGDCRTDAAAGRRHLDRDPGRRPPVPRRPPQRRRAPEFPRSHPPGAVGGALVPWNRDSWDKSRSAAPGVKARGVSMSGICERRATPLGEMPRPEVVLEITVPGD